MANKKFGPDMSRNKDLAGKTVQQGDYLVHYNADGYATRAGNTDYVAKSGNLNTDRWRPSQNTGSASYDADTDYSKLWQDQKQYGASVSDVLNTYNKRYQKSISTPGLEKFANDAIQQEMWDYIMANGGNWGTWGSDTGAPGLPGTIGGALAGMGGLGGDYGGSGGWGGGFNYGIPMPEYNSQYQAQIQAMLNSILNREDFKYDAASDPLYQQYKEQYLREGDRAMRNTMAEAAAGAGGMNSYAMTAAQQANDYYNAQLNDKIPELYQLAYQMYLQDIDGKVQDLGLLQQMDQTAYNQYRDTMSDWFNDRNFAYGQYRDDVADGQWQQQFDYNKFVNDRDYNYQVGRDQVMDGRYDQEWAYNTGRDQVSDSRYDSETAYAKAMDMLQRGVMPDGATLKAAGITSTEASAYIAAVKAATAPKTTGGGSSGGSKSSSGYSGNKTSSGSSGNGYTGGSNTGGDPYADTRNNATSQQADSNAISAGAMKKLNSLKLMQGSIGSKTAIANSIAVYADQGEITDAEARYMFKYFGYNPDEWLE